MKKQLTCLSTIAAATLMAGTAFAALPNLDAGNTSMATELIDPTLDTPAPQVFLAYQTNGAVAPTTQIKFTLTNGTFAGVAAAAGVTGWNLCSIDGALNITKYAATKASTAGDASVTLTLGTALGVGTVYYLQSDDCAAVLTATADIRVAGGMTAGTVSMAVTSVTNPGDAKVETNATVVTLVNELSATYSPVTSKMDFVTGRTTLIDDSVANPNFPNTVVAGNTSTSTAKIVVKSSNLASNGLTFGVNPNVGCAGTLDATDKFNAKVTGNLTGIDTITWSAPGVGGAPTTNYTVTATDLTNGYATVAVDGNKTGICSSSSPTAGTAPGLSLIIDTNAGTPKAPVLSAGSYTTELKFVGGGGASGALATRVLNTGNSHNIVFNGTQYYLELARADATRETYVKIQSKNTTAGANTLSVDVLCGNGTMKTFTPAATLTAGTPASITGTEMAAACASTSPVNANGFAAIITVNAPEEDVFGYANVLDSTGSKRVPLKTVGGTIVE